MLFVEGKNGYKIHKYIYFETIKVLILFDCNGYKYRKTNIEFSLYILLNNYLC